MWVFIEQIGDLYVGVAHDEDGRELLEITEPITYSAIHALMEPLSGGDCYDFDCAAYDAETRPRDGRTPERKFFHLLRVRAKAGLASESDAAWVLDQLHDQGSIHATTLLLWTLGYLGPRYEHDAASFLDHANTNGEAEYAMSALFQMGLLEKYIDRFVRWMCGAPPPRRRMGSTVYGMTVHAFRQSQNPKILRALIDASNDRAEKWTTREHARSCLASAIDLENAPLGQRLPPDHPYFVGVLEKAMRLLDELTTSERGPNNDRISSPNA
jgi:hypothetical protein